MSLKQAINNNLYLGIEFGNHQTFYSDEIESNCTEKKYYFPLLNREFTAEIDDAKGLIKEFVSINENKIERNLSFSATENAYLFDFVSRYVVFSNQRNAFINGIEITHNDSNIYYQYATEHPVKVPLGENQWLKFSDSGSSKEKYFDNVFYIRDESHSNGRYKWIVHHRKIVKSEYAELVLRGCNPRIEGVLPYQYLVPKFIKKALFRIRERKFPYFPIMAVGIVNVKGALLELKTTVSIINNGE